MFLKIIQRKTYLTPHTRE